METPACLIMSVDLHQHCNIYSRFQRRIGGNTEKYLVVPNMLNQYAPFPFCLLYLLRVHLHHCVNKRKNKSSLSLHSFILCTGSERERLGSVCVWVSAHIRVNTSGCGADTDKQIAAHTSLGAHLQTGARNSVLFSGSERAHLQS